MRQLIVVPAMALENASRGHTVMDFRLERLRRSLKDGPTPAARAVVEKYASSGLAEAQYRLGQMLLSSERPGDAEAAKGWLEAAAEQGHLPACREIWQTSAAGAGIKTSAKSLEQVIRAADLGDYQASAVLILLYGDSPNAEVPNMLTYLRQHVARGASTAQYCLGYAYDMGHFGVPRDAERAFELYMLSAQQGNAHAQCCVGICYASGLGVQQDDEQAVHWYSEAAKRGSAQAQHNLGYSYEHGRKPLRQSMREANRWYRRAALRDFGLAQYSLGLSYLNGRELPQNAELANRWFSRAAQQGCSPAQVALGYSCETGRGVAVSLPKAVELYEAAARAGDAQGQHHLAKMYLNGAGVEKDLTEAVIWCRKAAEQGHTSAQRELPAYLAYSNQQRGLSEARKALSVIEGRLRATDPTYEAKKALLVPILKPVFEQMAPSKWATAFEQAYAGVRLPDENAAQPMPATDSPTKASAASGESSSHGSMTVLLYKLTSHPGEVGISKIDPPLIDGAFFLDFGQPLRVLSRRCFGISNNWVGSVTELGVPVVHQLGVPVAHQGVGAENFLVYMHRTDPSFSDIRALWKARHPSDARAPAVEGAGLKIVADFAVQFPQGS
jgi:TPR repeat protein